MFSGCLKMKNFKIRCSVIMSYPAKALAEKTLCPARRLAISHKGVATYGAGLNCTALFPYAQVGDRQQENAMSCG